MDFTNKANDAEALLQFQDFGMESATTASRKPPSYEQVHQFSNYPASHVDIDEDSSQEDSRAATNTQEGGPSILSFSYYQRYFDVDTPQVKERLVWSFLPRPSRDTLTHFIRPTPDLYGPFWICVTLVFCIAIMGNIADYLHSGGEGQHWRYDFRKVSISATTIFSYALLLPLILWVLLWWRRKENEQTPLGFIEIVSLYGYSLAIYIPISVLWTIPYPLLQWTLVILGAALSGSVLVFSLWPPLSASQRGMAVALLSAVLAFHFLLAAGLQLYFFRYANTTAIVTNSSSGLSSGNLLAADSSLDKVTELQPLNLVLDFEGQRDSTIHAAANAKPLSTATNNTITKKNESQPTTAPKNEKREPVLVTTNEPNLGSTTLPDTSTKSSKLLIQTTKVVTVG